MKSISLNAVFLLGMMSVCQQGALADDYQLPRIRIVGTWSLSLDAGSFDPGLAGLALSGLITFHRDGTVLSTDAGDFGSLGTLDSNQFGIWKRSADGNTVIARTLMLSAAPDSGEPTHWLRVNVLLTRGANRNHLTGWANLDMLGCEPQPPFPGALTCPDPVTHQDDFVAIEPFNIPIEYHRLQLPIGTGERFFR